MTSTLLPNRAASPDDFYGEAPPVNDDADSKGSSVSSRLQEEYENALKTAILMPNVENIPAIVDQFLGAVAREVDTYPPGHVFSSAHLVDLSDDENPRLGKSSSQPSKRPGSSTGADGTDIIIDIIGKELSLADSKDEEAVKFDREKSASACDNKFSSSAKIFFGSNPNIQSENTTSSESDTMFRNGALPKARFVPEKPASQPTVPLKSGTSRQTVQPVTKPKSKLLYQVPPRQLINFGPDTSGGSALDQLASCDGDMARTENLLDQWSGELKRNILAEFGQAKCRIAGNFHQMLSKEKDKHNSELHHIRDEVDSVRELLATYELSLTRKDQVISNLTQSLHRHRDRIDMQKRFADWRQQHADKRREAFCTKLAAQHYERCLYRTIWNAWHSLLVGKWRHRVERACQAKAQEVCLELTNDYEAKISSLNEALEASRNEVKRLHREREWYEENMKKAFMRGVCALNMEALGMFKPPEGDHDVDDTADVAEEAEVTVNSMPEHVPIMPFFAPMPTGGSATSNNAAPVYSITKESASIKTAARKPAASENVRPAQRMIRAQFVARDVGGVTTKANRTHDPSRRTVMSPSCKGHVAFVDEPKRQRSTKK